MTVTGIAAKQTQHYTIFSADFTFSSPYGGRRQKIMFWLRWLWQFFINPVQTLQHGYTVKKNIWYKIPRNYAKFDNVADAFFILSLPLAIAMNEDLFFEGVVAKEVMTKSSKINDFYHEVAKRRINIQVKTKNNLRTTIPLGGQFFTLGVDSFYTLGCYSEKNEPSRLLMYVDGYDVPFYQKKFLGTIHQHITKVAKKTEHESLFVETNLRDISDAVIGWGRYHVSALVAVSTIIGLQKVYISGESFDAPDWGLRFGVDRLYSTKNQKIKLVGHAVLRAKKIKKIIHSKYATLFLKHVRVCWENVRLPWLPYNCSVCQKCLKTKLTLLSLGVQKTPTLLFPKAEAIEKLHLVEHVFAEWQQMYQELRNNTEIDNSILMAIDKVLKKPLRV